MKYLIITLFLVSCYSKQKDAVIPKSDTIRTVALFGFPGDTQLRFDIVYRIVRDTFRLNPVDSITFKKGWGKDTVYFVPVRKGDSSKVQWVGVYPNIILVDGNKNVDSITKAFFKK